jgi:hypothetical protein
MARDVDEFLDQTSGAKVFKFTDEDRKISGQVIRAEVLPVRDYKTGKIETWDNGDQKEQLVLTFQSDQVTPTKDDDGRRRVFCKHRARVAVAEACRDAEVKLSSGNAWVALEYTGRGEKAKGMEPPMLFKAEARSMAGDPDEVPGGVDPDDI